MTTDSSVVTKVITLLGDAGDAEPCSGVRAEDIWGIFIYHLVSSVASVPSFLLLFFCLLYINPFSILQMARTLFSEDTLGSALSLLKTLQ